MNKKTILLLILALCLTSCGHIDRIRDWWPTSPPEQPVEPPEPIPLPPVPERVNKGGDGLYKLSTDLWLLPSSVRPEGLTDAAILTPDGMRRANLQWPRNVGHGNIRVDVRGNVPDYGSADLYHGGRLKLRNVGPARTGDTLIAYGLAGEPVAWMIIVERGIRQEGRR